MADSKMSQDETHSLVMRAMAWRVKYRQTDGSGKVIKVIMSIGSLGVHPKNRGGVYPAGKRCRNLCMDVVGGIRFLKENIEHAVVGVEEVPVEVASSRGAKFLSGSQYNIKQCKQDEFLMGCFAVPHNHVQCKMLSHNHMILVLRAFLTKALWQFPANEEKGLVYCDAQGKLSISAVADHPNLKQLAETIAEGVEIELLDCKMDIEEPSAASIISQSLNIEQELALRTSELTAVAVLKGEMIVQMGKDLSQKVAYKSVIAKVRKELKIGADDPDLPDVFDYLRSLAVGKNTYVDIFAFLFLLPSLILKKQEMRFSALAVVNRIRHDCPLSMVVV